MNCPLFTGTRSPGRGAMVGGLEVCTQVCESEQKRKEAGGTGGRGSTSRYLRRSTRILRTRTTLRSQTLHLARWDILLPPPQLPAHLFGSHCWLARLGSSSPGFRVDVGVRRARSDWGRESRSALGESGNLLFVVATGLRCGLLCRGSSGPPDGRLASQSSPGGAARSGGLRHKGGVGDVGRGNKSSLRGSAERFGGFARRPEGCCGSLPLLGKSVCVSGPLPFFRGSRCHLLGLLLRPSSRGGISCDVPPQRDRALPKFTGERFSWVERLPPSFESLECGKGESRDFQRRTDDFATPGAVIRDIHAVIRDPLRISP